MEHFIRRAHKRKAFHLEKKKNKKRKAEKKKKKKRVHSFPTFARKRVLRSVRGILRLFSVVKKMTRKRLLYKTRITRTSLTHSETGRRLHEEDYAPCSCGSEGAENIPEISGNAEFSILIGLQL